MAYDKKYPNINDEILAFDKGQEDRTEKSINAMKDYPVELSAGYEKWASGKIVQYGQTTIVWETSKALGSTGWFYGSEITIKYPRPFNTQPEFYFEVIVGNTIVAPQARRATNGSFIFIMVSPYKYEDLRNDKLHWRAIGRWKEE